MSETRDLLSTRFEFGSTTVEILEGNILDPGVDIDAVVSTDDNYMTMGSGGVSGSLCRLADSDKYMRDAQAHCPVKAGTVVCTKPYGLKDRLGVACVLHGAVIDYDTADSPLADVVEQTTANCLTTAENLNGENLNLASILFPAFATGAGKLDMETCAQRMCNAIKAHVATECLLKKIYIILYLPEENDGTSKSAQVSDCEERNQRFIREANLVLGIPYNPGLEIRQTRDFYGRDKQLQQLVDIITGDNKAGDDSWHAVLLGGPGSGKKALLGQLHALAQEEGSPLSQGRRLVKVSFGQVHDDTPLSFVYRKFLCCLEIEERRTNPENEKLIEAIKDEYTRTDMDSARFLAFLKAHEEHFPEVVFLIDRLPRLLRMEGSDPEKPDDIRRFWEDLDQLQERVRFVYTARDDEYQTLRQERLERCTTSFRDRIAAIRLACVTQEERKDWVNRLFARYLDWNEDAPDAVHRFFEEEAGRHPYLISLTGYALIKAIKEDAIKGPEHHPEKYTDKALQPFLRHARQSIEIPRRSFFDRLLAFADGAHQIDLQNLSEAVAIEEERASLIPDLERGDPNATRRMEELQDEIDPRRFLHRETLQELEDWGHIVDAETPKTAQFCAKPLGSYLQEYFRVRRRVRADQPKDMVISLLRHYHREESLHTHVEDSVAEKDNAQPKAHNSHALMILTMFRARGARVVTARKPLLPEIKQEFMESFGQLVSHRLHPVKDAEPGPFRNLEEVGSYILTQFTTVDIKRQLQNLPHGSMVMLMVDDALKDIPWELMLETAYAGEIPFKVGRVIVSPQQPQFLRRELWDGKIKALLIADPTDELELARREVGWLVEMFERDERFAQPDIVVGSEDCDRIGLLNRLSSGEYGLVHYSGHTKYHGEKSSWQLEDGDITTDMLTNALQMAPPAMVFSSSCESAKASASTTIEYESQSFDLPSAFLQAGVEAYVGTLWNVSETPAQQFVEEFYSAFLTAEYDLGECLRRAKWACKQRAAWNERISYLAYVLYGDPHTKPSDLFPALETPAVRGG